LCLALGIDARHNSVALDRPPLLIRAGEPTATSRSRRGLGSPVPIAAARSSLTVRTCQRRRRIFPGGHPEERSDEGSLRQGS
jgi:hypothetical protein